MRDICWHTLRVMGAKELVRRRRQAGWPNERCRPPRGWHVVCTTCLLTLEEADRLRTHTSEGDQP